MIERTTAFMAVCDKCGEQFGGMWFSHEVAINEAADLGWLSLDGAELCCPNCQRTINACPTCGQDFTGFYDRQKMEHICNDQR